MYLRLQRLDVRVVIPYLNFHCSLLKDPADYQEQIRKDWVRLALADVGLLSAILLATCRHLCLHYSQDGYAMLAMQYKHSCLHALRKAISVEASLARDSTIASALALAFDEVGHTDKMVPFLPGANAHISTTTGYSRRFCRV
jgi:hypothetical protein